MAVFLINDLVMVIDIVLSFAVEILILFRYDARANNKLNTAAQYLLQLDFLR